MSDTGRAENEGLYKVLVVDDDAGLRQMVHAQLSGHYEVILAEGGAQALRVIEDEDSFPDIMLLDIDMPGMDGYETLKALRANPDTEDIPVIFLTGLDGVRDQVKGLESGVADYIVKPFVKDILLARLRLHLGAGMERRKMRNARKNGMLAELDEEKFAQLTEMLGDREKEVAKLMTLGHSNQDIAEILAYSLDGVKKMTSRVYNKTGLSDRYELKKTFLKKH